MGGGGEVSSHFIFVCYRKELFVKSGPNHITACDGVASPSHCYSLPLCVKGSCPSTRSFGSQ